MSDKATFVVDLWQLLAAAVVYTGGIAGTVIYINRLLPIDIYNKRHKELEDRIRSIENWANMQGFHPPAE